MAGWLTVPFPETPALHRGERNISPVRCATATSGRLNACSDVDGNSPFLKLFVEETGLVKWLQQRQEAGPSPSRLHRRGEGSASTLLGPLQSGGEQALQRRRFPGQGTSMSWERGSIHVHA